MGRRLSDLGVAYWGLPTLVASGISTIIEIAVDPHHTGDKRMRPNAPDIAGDALSLTLDGQPVDEVTF